MTWQAPPFFDKQFSNVPNHYVDADNCVEQALCHAIYMMTGRRYSPRALGWMVDVQPSGSEVSQAVKIANLHGLIPYELWPTPETFTWASYYADLPQSVLDKAEFWNIQLIPPDLNKSPILTEIVFGPNAIQPGPYHLLVQFNPTQYFDSETWNQPTAPLEPIGFLGTKVLWQSSIKLTPKGKRMSQIKQQNNKGELRVELACSTIEEWNALCKILGLDPNHFDETIN